MKYKLIIFDFDGVIIDSWEHAYKRNVRDWPDLKPDEHKRFFNGNVYEEVKKMPPSKYSKEETQQWIQEVYLPAKMDLPLFEGIEYVLKELSKDNTLVINTSADAATTEKYLQKHSLRNYFKGIYGLEISSNKTEKFAMILDDYNCSSEEAILVTDTVGDVIEAKVVSIPSLVVTYGYQDRSYFKDIEEEAIGFADTPAEILKFLKVC